MTLEEYLYEKTEESITKSDMPGRVTSKIWRYAPSAESLACLSDAAIWNMFSKVVKLTKTDKDYISSWVQDFKNTESLLANSASYKGYELEVLFAIIRKLRFYPETSFFEEVGLGEKEFDFISEYEDKTDPKLLAEMEKRGWIHIMSEEEMVKKWGMMMWHLCNCKSKRFARAVLRYSGVEEPLVASIVTSFTEVD